MWSGPFYLRSTICFGTLGYQSQQNANGDPGPMSTPVYYLKIRVKILNKMTVCKPQTRALIWGAEYVSLLFLCPPSFRKPMQDWPMGEAAGTRGTAQDGELVEEGQVGRERPPCILLLFSLFLPGWEISRPPGLGRRVISASAGERRLRSSVSHALRRQVEGARAWRRCSLAQVPHKVWGMRKQCLRT